MNASPKKLISIVAPLFNEREVVLRFDASLRQELATLSNYDFEIIYCDDGSTDGTLARVQELCAQHTNTQLIRFSRNFGKEVATTAGIHAARGEAVITIDSDGQHPVEMLSQFIAKWREGSHVVIGVRTANQREGVVKHAGSKLFYALFNRLSGIRLVPGSTDYRLIDKIVQHDFMQMTEHNRITRGLIDWLGYERAFVHFKAHPRLQGRASYSFKKLSRLAVDSVISLSIAPLYATAYVGAIILPISVLLGLAMIVDALLGDPLQLHATGSAYVMVLLLFLVSVLMVSQGISGLYLSHIHAETQNRPLYVIDETASRKHHA
ncbi:MAG: glycosyltransferase family 2 protein [Candidatus Saccharimonadales bacterium]